MRAAAQFGAAAICLTVIIGVNGLKLKTATVIALVAKPARAGTRAARKYRRSLAGRSRRAVIARNRLFSRVALASGLSVE
jgi:hypothetical protein